MMKAMRRWLLLVAAGWFVAGIAIGLAVPRAIELVFPADSALDPDEDYVRRMIEEYQLGS